MIAFYWSVVYWLDKKRSTSKYNFQMHLAAFQKAGSLNKTGYRPAGTIS
jgi:hypothetical protein